MIKEKYNIAVFSFAYSPFEGGAEIAVREVMRRLKNFNFSVFTYKFERSWLSKETQDNVEIIRLGGGSRKKKKYGRIMAKIFYVLQAWQEAECLHQQKRFDAIWVIMASYGGIAALFFKLSHPKIPMLLTIQEGDSEQHMVFGKFGLVGFWARQIIKKADYIQAISSYLKDFVFKRGAHVPIEVIPNGVDLDLFDTSYKDSEKKALRENLGIKDDYVIVTTSRLVWKNGVDILIDAVAKLKEKRPNIKCLIIGDGPEGDKLKVKSKKLKVDGKVIFLGQIPQRDLPLYLKISDIFVRPSRSEGLGSSFLEAMASGLPVIGTPVGGIVDFLRDEETGIFVKPEDPEDLAKKIFMLLGNSDLKKRIISNAKILTHQSYSWETIAILFKNIFDRLINL